MIVGEGTKEGGIFRARAREMAFLLTNHWFGGVFAVRNWVSHE